MALLDEANTTAYGNPEISEVNIGVGKNPGILISGHDLKDMEDLLKQTAGTGIDVYTHGEMLSVFYKQINIFCLTINWSKTCQMYPNFIYLIYF